MNRLELFRSFNPDKNIYTVHDSEFAPYGRVVSNVDVSDLIAAAETYSPLPRESFLYEPSVPVLEEHPAAKKLVEVIWGCGDVQIGLGRGNANRLDALEWHTCGESCVAVTDMVLLLADRREIVNGWLDSSCVRAFYCAKGEVIDLYATTLHYCPSEVDSNGLSCIVMLDRGTNTELGTKADDPLLTACNKWIFAHEECHELLEQGVIPGIRGENLSYKSIAF